MIAACIVVTWYFQKSTNLLSPDTKIMIEEAILNTDKFPARPVWWQDDSVLAVGVVKVQKNHDLDAADVCGIAAKHGVYDVLVEIYDVERIQRESDWVRIGSANCATLEH